MLCAGRDRSLQCNRSSLKSTSNIHFCREHAPSGSQDITPDQQEYTDSTVAQFRRSDSSVDDNNSISSDFDDSADSKAYFVLLSSLTGSNSSQTKVKSALVYVMSKRNWDSCKTRGCHNVAGSNGYCTDCHDSRSSLPAVEYTSEATASDDVEQDDSSEQSPEEVKPQPLSQSTDGDDAEMQQHANSSSSSRAQPHSVSEGAVTLCVGPYCNNVGVEEFRGLCKACYEALSAANYKPLYDDFDAGLD